MNTSSPSSRLAVYPLGNSEGQRIDCSDCAPQGIYYSLMLLPPAVRDRVIAVLSKNQPIFDIVHQENGHPAYAVVFDVPSAGNLDVESQITLQPCVVYTGESGSGWGGK